MVSAWDKTIAIAEKYNEPGRFTAIIGYEWTVNAGGGDNLHRNVIYRDGADQAKAMVPLTTFQTEDPEGLWKWMAEYEAKTGGKLLAIPHNGNLSNGRMFEETDASPASPDPRVCRGASQLGAALRDHPDQGPERSASRLSPTDEFARVRSVGRGQPERGAEEARHAGAPSTGARHSSPESASRPRSAPIRSSTARTGPPTRTPGSRPRMRTTSGASSRRVEPSGRAVGVSRSCAAMVGWTQGGRRKDGRLGDREHPRGDLGRDEAARRRTRRPGRAWRCGSSAAWTSPSGDARGATSRRRATPRACPWAATSQAAPAGKAPTFPGRGDEGSDRREPRSRPDRQGLGRRGGQSAREDLRRGLVRTTGRPAPTGKLPPSATRSIWRHATWTRTRSAPRSSRSGSGSGVRSQAARVLLRARDRDPDAALDYLRRHALRYQDPAPTYRSCIRNARVTSPIWYSDPAARRRDGELIAIRGGAVAARAARPLPRARRCCSSRCRTGAAAAARRRTASSSRPGQIDSMVATFARTWQRPPTEEELKGLVDDYVRDELADPRRRWRSAWTGTTP